MSSSALDSKELRGESGIGRVCMYEHGSSQDIQPVTRQFGREETMPHRYQDTDLPEVLPNAHLTLGGTCRVFSSTTPQHSLNDDP
ncbi:hypothetical protein CFAM422_003091 [Trichoderma lentiforme]|uniref:Uncharacterized protein n=1 Tax=Trichoderma lentiforme TaxID=1567552 RepID=A0A9P4XMT5_9HYPO|nr:hypothetical protein CFAM422_003091 [Trichoderma lentiforme]